MARPAVAIPYRCTGTICVHAPILGVWEADGSLRIRKDAINALITSGEITLTCRQCGQPVSLSVPLVESSVPAVLSMALRSRTSRVVNR